MRRLSALLLALVALGAFAGLAPVAVGQEHEHEVSTGVVIAHDLPPSGRTYVGNLDHFVVLYLGDDGVPDFHQQNQVRVLLNEVVVFETTDDSGHDYDGVYGFDVTFLTAGTYRVEALQEGVVKARFGGRVDVPNTDVVGVPGAEMSVLLPIGLGQGTQTLAYAAMSDGAPIAHSDAVYEVYTQPDDLQIAPAGDPLALQSPDLVLRIKTHTHEDHLQQVTTVFPPESSYRARVQTYRAFPSSGLDFQPGVDVLGFSTGPGVQVLPSEVPATPGLPDNVVVSAVLGDLTLIGTFDPYNVVGPDTLMHLTVTVLDANRTPVQHVNFAAELVGPDGTILLSSATLHEYDGVLEIDTLQATPGPYVLRVTADRGTTATIELPYTVSPAAPDLAQGPQIVTITGTEGITVGQTADLNLHIADVAGNPFQHNEVDVVIERGRGGDEGLVPILRAKLHTHADGDFPFKLAFQEPGWYHVRLSPFPLGAQAAPQFYLNQVGQEIAINIEVGPGEFPQPGPTDSGGGAATAQDTPVPAIVALAAIALAFAVSRRR